MALSCLHPVWLPGYQVVAMNRISNKLIQRPPRLTPESLIPPACVLGTKGDITLPTHESFRVSKTQDPPLLKSYDSIFREKKLTPSSNSYEIPYSDCSSQTLGP